MSIWDRRFGAFESSAMLFHAADLHKTTEVPRFSCILELIDILDCQRLIAIDSALLSSSHTQP